MVLIQEYAQAPSPELARKTAEEILQAGAYSEVKDGAGVGDIWARLIEKWQEFQEWLRELQMNSPGHYWLLVAGLILLLVLLIWHIVWTIRYSSRWVGWEEKQAELRHAQSPEQALTDAAENALAEGRRIEALSFRFRLALFRHSCNHPGVLRPGWTNRECLTAWQNKPEVMASMTGVVRLLDRCWYAQQECGPDEFEQAWAVLEDKQVE